MRDGVGETLSPAANALLGELGVEDLFAAGPHRLASAAYAAWEAPVLAQRHAIAQVGNVGYVIDRGAFEHMMLRAAARTPTLIVPVALRRACRHADSWSFDLADGCTLMASQVIDCSGRAAVFARQFSHRYRVDQLVAASCVLEQQAHDIEPSSATLIEAAANGWWYATLLPDRRLGVLFFSDPDLIPPGLSQDAAFWRDLVERTQFVSRWLASAGFVVNAPPRLRSAATTWMDPAGGSAWIAAGDAAAAFDPLSSHGLTTALWGGLQAGRAARARLSGDDGPTARYALTVSQAMQQFLVQRRAIYSRVQRFADAPFWKRRVAAGL